MKIKLTLRRVKLLTAGCLISFGLSAQIFQKVGNGLSKTGTIYSEAMLADGGNIYSSYLNYYYQGQNLIVTGFVEKWNGLAWSQYPPIQGKQITDLAVFQNELYAAAVSYTSTSYIGNVYKFDGTNWNIVFPNLNGIVRKLKVFNGELVVAGGFTESSSGEHNIIGYDGNTVTTYPSLAVTDSILDVNIINNELWIAGQFTRYSGSDSSSVMRLSGSTWVYPAIAHKPITNWSYCESVFQYNGKIYSIENNGLYELKNDTAYFVTNTNAHSGVENNGSMYLTNGNGLMLFDGTAVAQVAGAPYGVGSIASDGTYLYGTFSDTNKINGQYYNHVFKTNSQYGLMHGNTFVDVNGNCTYEPAIDGYAEDMRMTSQSPMATSFKSNYQGKYQVALPPGTYTFAQISSYSRMNTYLVPACGSANSVTITQGQSVAKDFILTHDGTNDVISTITASRGKWARQGFTEYYKLKISNPGDDLVNPVTATVNIPATVNFVSSNPSPANISGNTYTYSFAGMAERTYREVWLKVEITRTQNPVGTVLEFISDVTGVPGDVDLNNNKDTARVNVVASCDPNDKNANVEQALPGLSSIDYHIRFQNTGTDTAFKVVIVDTLDSSFKIEELRINDASHSYDLNVLDDHILVWTFDNILLPDSGANQLASQGFIDFTIGVDNTLPLGSIIDNDAEIYFDYQPAVHTNHAQTQIVMNVSLVENSKALIIDVFPNPAKDELHILNNESELIKFQLINSAGVVVDEVRAEPEARTTIRVNELSPGLYLLKGENSTYKIIVK